MNLVELSKYLFWSSIIVWLFPPIRQFKGSYFIFFLILAITDPLSYLYTFILFIGANNLWIYLISFYLIIVSISDKDNIKKYKYFYIIFFIILILLLFLKLEYHYYLLLIVVEHLVIFFMFLKLFITGYVNNNKFNIFLIILLAYELLFILKYFILLAGFADADAFFMVTSFAQIAIGLFFSIFREGDPKLMVKL